MHKEGIFFKKNIKFSLGKGPSSLGKRATSLRNNVLSLGKGLSSSRKSATSSKNNVFFLEEGPSSIRNNRVLNHFVITIISCSFSYIIVTYHHWKCVKKGYNFVVESISIRIHMKKLCLHKILDTFVPLGT